MPHKLVKVICRAHFVELDEDGSVIAEHLGEPVPRYGRESVASFYDHALAELEQLDEAKEES